MKHNINVTALIIGVFFLTQVVGLYLVNLDISSVQEIDGEIVVEHQETSIGPRPETTGFGSFLYLTIAVVVGTILVLIIMRFGQMKLWKIWFFFAVFFSISIALGVFLNYNLAFFFAFILTCLKLFKRNVFFHNTTEVLMYSGLAVLLAPIFDLFWAFVLLGAISLYDMYAVWKSKHMVKMAKFQAKSQLFAGLMIPYQEEKGMEIEIPAKPELGKTGQKKIKNAILGGGDVAFPLIFSAVVMEDLIVKGVLPNIAFFQALVISVFVTLAILGLFMFAKKDKFYPAMPMVTAGCVLGYLVVLLF